MHGVSAKAAADLLAQALYWLICLQSSHAGPLAALVSLRVIDDKADRHSGQSTHDKGQDPENQLLQLRAWCERAGHELHREYVEHESGTKGERDRKAFAELLAAAARREFDLVLFWSLDRFSREGMAQTVGYLQRLQANGVDFHSYTEEYLATDNEWCATSCSPSWPRSRRWRRSGSASAPRQASPGLARTARSSAALPCPTQARQDRAPASCRP